MGVTFTWLASEHFLKVRGTTHLQVEFFKKSDLQTPWPHPQPCRPSANAIGQLSGKKRGPVPIPVERGVHATFGPSGRGTSRSCDSAPGRGHGSFPLLSLVWGAARRGAEVQTRSGMGRGAFTVQDTHRRHAEVTRLVGGPGS